MEIITTGLVEAAELLGLVEVKQELAELVVAAVDLLTTQVVLAVQAELAAVQPLIMAELVEVMMMITLVLEV
jgi:predicted nucleotidyltransferase